MSEAKNYFPSTGKWPAEKSKFVQTCNRLSLFLKEKGKLRQLSFEIDAKSDTTGIPEATPTPAPAPATVDLLSNMNNPRENASQAEKSENILPDQYVILDSSTQLQDSTMKPTFKKTVKKPKTAQMTIFYGGEILVLDDVPADRARDVMLIAQKNHPPDGQIGNPASKLPLDVSVSADADEQANGSDLPIARRASLHKFLAKRKDRATVRSPYNYLPGASSSGTEHGFDLNH